MLDRLVDFHDPLQESDGLGRVSFLVAQQGNVEQGNGFTGQAFAFGPADDITYSSVIAEVTPAEMEKIHQGEIPLPAGWSLETATAFLRPKDADAA